MSHSDDMSNPLYDKVSLLLSWGLNTVEIAAILNIHRVTVQRYKSKLKENYWKEFR